MLLFNKKLTASQAYELGLVTEVFPDASFQSEVWPRLEAYAKLPRNVRYTLDTFCHTRLHTFTNLLDNTHENDTTLFLTHSLVVH